MNYRVLGRFLGLLTLVLAANQVAPLVCAIIYGEAEAAADFIFAILAAAILGGVLFLKNRETTQEVYRKEALAIVGLGWLLTAFIGGLPYFFYGLGGDGPRPFGALWDCYFESMSGFTTTGATILTDIESLPRSILFWRSYTHWLGGMGIIVLFVAVLPYLGAGGKQLFRSEVPGPVKEGLRPRIRDSATMLWKIYLGLTVAQTIALMLCGLNLYESLCHTFGTLATGGFSTWNASVAHYDSAAIDWVIVFFMYAAGINFSLHFSLLRRGRWHILRDTEWRWYTGILAVSTLVITVLVWQSGQAESGVNALRLAAFQVVSIMTTTGYCTANFDLWPEVARLLLIILMFIGACAGSTGGGMKVIRVVTVVKSCVHHLEQVFSPRLVRRLRLGRDVVEPSLQVGVLSFFVLGILIFVASALLLATLGYDLTTALTAVAASLFNIGPGLGRVGAVENYAFFDPFTKMWLSLLMVLGRLELYSILVLLVPSFWRSH